MNWTLGPVISRKLQLEGMATFALSRGKPPYKIAVYAPGHKVQYNAHRCITLASTYIYTVS